MSNQHNAGIKISNLYKIFGPNAGDYVDAVKKGMPKSELLDKHGHVLGLKDISLDIPAGSIQVIMGLSGSGKSTLIRHINRLIDPTAGEVIVGGSDVTKMDQAQLQDFRRSQTAMVFQKFALLPHRNVLENVVYGLEIRGVDKAESVNVAKRWIERVGLKGFEKRYPTQLSGGMQQRVGLARALSMDAPVLLMDEAYSALDPLIRMDMQTVLLDIQKEIKKTIVFITHDLDEALRLGDQISILRDGQMIQQGTKQDIVMRPADEYVENFVRQVNRAKIVTLEGVMSPVKPNPTLMAPTLQSWLTIEEAVQIVRSSPDSEFVVVDTLGQPVGLVTLQQLLFAMVAPAALLEGDASKQPQLAAVPSARRG
ncbi:proline/glycine betaine ABC transporter ATP-binding protein [Pseudomonas sp. PAGU 2196]|uniref:quaternary amine ABC transporter ATP-binding protein n=1 Tax=Pseudomonas sp. PAGU 2196 TaxID=2793997 RepID=UPI001EDF6B38|nr:glycine betaine/L-proline ABC transporter ATP-binding protein [Pseudomonas sp. PAGU 2196]GHS84189.1 proline/glycine betaine ABC transporter ATP-binding protein [Pseudomonas sp. PAGU 2196]